MTPSEAIALIGEPLERRHDDFPSVGHLQATQCSLSETWSYFDNADSLFATPMLWLRFSAGKLAFVYAARHDWLGEMNGVFVLSEQRPSPWVATTFEDTFGDGS